ncbi:hypothetical protein H2203_007701 [Taxawa tesnikishii (nom. ined.)]|nr:hypothetical protein H2203_007701 [Dothideales sp. JES 119]
MSVFRSSLPSVRPARLRPYCPADSQTASRGYCVMSEFLIRTRTHIHTITPTTATRQHRQAGRSSYISHSAHHRHGLANSQRDLRTPKILTYLRSFTENSPPAAPATPTLQDHLSDLWYEAYKYISSRSTLENSGFVLATLAFLILIMSWSSRFSKYAGQFSPFGRSSPTSSTQNKRISYPVHFPAYSIDKGELKVGQVREQAAKKVGAADARRIKLLYRGQNLKDDERTCRAMGLRDGAEILCTVGDAPAESSDSEDDGEDDGVPLEGEGETPKRKRNRNRNRKKKGKRAGGSSGADTPVDTLPVPPSETSRAPSPKPAPTPSAPIDKLDALHHKLQELLPFQKEFEHKKLSETVLAQVLLKLDAVETEGDPEARARRKELVKEAQRILNGLDDAMK